MSYKISNRSIRIILVVAVLLLAANAAPVYASQEHYMAGVYAEDSNSNFGIASYCGMYALYARVLGDTYYASYFNWYAYVYSYEAYTSAYWSYYYSYYGYSANASWNDYSYDGYVNAYYDYTYKSCTQYHVGSVYYGYDAVAEAIDCMMLADYYNGLSLRYNNLASDYGLY